MNIEHMYDSLKLAIMDASECGDFLNISAQKYYDETTDTFLWNFSFKKDFGYYLISALETEGILKLFSEIEDMEALEFLSLELESLIESRWDDKLTETIQNNYLEDEISDYNARMRDL